MSDTQSNQKFVFPRWANYAIPVLGIAVLGGLFYVPTLLAVGASPKTTAVGYAPEQPVPYSHAMHAGKLGLDCRYCHTTVEGSAFAAIPPTQTCMNCHSVIRAKGKDADGKEVENPVLKPVFESWRTGKPVEWVKIHDLPDYAFFNHSAHVNQGIGCVSCHGRVDQMDIVYQAKPLSMGWCLECHREPEKNLRPKDQITNMSWKAIDDPIAKAKNITDPEQAQLEVGRHYKKMYGIRDMSYMTGCYTCHR